MIDKCHVTTGGPLSCLEHTLLMLVGDKIVDAEYEVHVLIICIHDFVTNQHLQCMCQASLQIGSHHTVFVHQLHDRCAHPLYEGQQSLSCCFHPCLTLNRHLIVQLLM